MHINAECVRGINLFTRINLAAGQPDIHMHALDAPPQMAFQQPCAVNRTASYRKLGEGLGIRLRTI